jgi:hypothetical protein
VQSGVAADVDGARAHVRVRVFEESTHVLRNLRRRGRRCCTQTHLHVDGVRDSNVDAAAAAVAAATTAAVVIIFNNANVVVAVGCIRRLRVHVIVFACAAHLVSFYVDLYVDLYVDIYVGDI